MRTNLKKHNNRHVYTYIHLHNFENPQKQLKLPVISIKYAMSNVNEQDASGANAMMSMSRGNVRNTVNSSGGRSSLSTGKSVYTRSRGRSTRGGGVGKMTGGSTSAIEKIQTVRMCPDQYQDGVEQMGPVVAIRITVTDHVQVVAQEVARVLHQVAVTSIMKIMDHTCLGRGIWLAKML